MCTLGDYEGLTYFSAALRAGLLLHPIVGQGPAVRRGRVLQYDPGHSRATQRAQVIGQIATHLAAQNGGSVADHAQGLHERLLPA